MEIANTLGKFPWGSNKVTATKYEATWWTFNRCGLHHIFIDSSMSFRAWESKPYPAVILDKSDFGFNT